MDEGQREDKGLVLVALEGEIANLEKLLTLAGECGFRKLLSALVKDLHKSGAEVVEIIAMAAADEPRERFSGAVRPELRVFNGIVGGVRKADDNLRSGTPNPPMTPGPPTLR